MLDVVLVFADERRRSAQIVPHGHPEEVQNQQIPLSRTQPCSSPYHLTVEASYLCRPEHYHAVARWTVPTFGQEHGVAQDRSRARLVEPFKRLFAVLARSVDFSRPRNQRCEFLRYADKRAEHYSLAIPCVDLYRCCYLLEIRLERFCDAVDLEVADRYLDIRHIDLKWKRKSRYRAQVTVLYGIFESVLVGDTVKDFG